jgi:hypothetical protein
VFHPLLSESGARRIQEQRRNVRLSRARALAVRIEREAASLAESEYLALPNSMDAAYSSAVAQELHG